MIRYDLKCSEGHPFDSWFASSAAYDRLHHAGCVCCPVCGSTQIEKALMAPALRTAGAPDTPATAAGEATAAPDQAPALPPAPQRQEAIAALKREIERRSEYVGLSFAKEARRIHAGEAPERMIHGEADLKETRALIEEGVPIAPLPFIPTRRTN